MTRHQAYAKRGQYHDPCLWRALCPCGWRAEAKSKQDAERLAKVHSWAVPAERRIVNATALVDKLVDCKCDDPGDYDPVSMEYSPVRKPCPKHALLAEFGVIEEGAA